MPSATYAGHIVDVDDQGYMTDPSQWSREIAVEIADTMGLSSLTDAHWRIIAFCRADQESQGEPPGLRRISDALGIHTRDLYKLFPKGPGKMAARIAGLRKPPSCI